MTSVPHHRRAHRPLLSC